MIDRDLVTFLQETLPRLGMRWSGFRKVRRQVGRRLDRRLRELALQDLAAYRARLDADPTELARLDAMCRITISRFYRDRRVFDDLRRAVLPDLAALARARAEPLRILSAGCASGEEPYTLVLAVHFDLHPPPALQVVAVDADDHMLDRARAAAYPRGALKDLPPAWLDAAFERRGDLFHLRPEHRAPVAFHRADIRTDLPPGPFHLALSRYLPFTYFDEAGQRTVLDALVARLAPGAALVIGAKEHLPPHPALEPWPDLRAISQRGSTGLDPRPIKPAP